MATARGLQTGKSKVPSKSSGKSPKRGFAQGNQRDATSAIPSALQSERESGGKNHKPGAGQKKRKAEVVVKKALESPPKRLKKGGVSAAARTKLRQQGKSGRDSIADAEKGAGKFGIEGKGNEDGAAATPHTGGKAPRVFSAGKKNKKGSSSVALDRKQRKELTEERRRKRKPHYELEKRLTILWERARRRNIEAEKRAKLISEMLGLMGGKMLAMARSHTASRVLQMCVKHCGPAERQAVFAELRPHCLDMAQNVYAHHLVARMLDHGSRDSRAQIVAQFRGHVVGLLRHPVASAVVEQAYSVASAAERRQLLAEFFSPEFKHFPNAAASLPGRGRLGDYLGSVAPPKRRVVLEHVSQCLQPILEKGIVDHSIVHRLLLDFLTCAPPRAVGECVGQLNGPLLLRMLHTRDGACVASLCVAAGSAKERKKVVKALKGHVGKVARDEHGHTVLLRLLDVVDDTKLLSKIVAAELTKELLPLLQDKVGRRPILHLLAPRCPRYFPANVLAALETSLPTASGLGHLSGEVPAGVGGGPVPQGGKEEDVGDGGAGKGNTGADEGDERGGGREAEEEAKGVFGEEGAGEEEGEAGQESEGEDEEESGGAVRGMSKKSGDVRRRELLIDSGLGKALAATCAENAGELVRSKFGTDVIYEVARGGQDGLLLRAHAEEVRAVWEALALEAAGDRGVAEAHTGENGGEQESQPQQHVLEDFFASRTLRRLISGSGVTKEVAPERRSREEGEEEGEGEGGGGGGGEGAQGFAALLWEKALRGRCRMWGMQHSAKIVAAAATAQHEGTRRAALEEIAGFVDLPEFRDLKVLIRRGRE